MKYKVGDKFLVEITEINDSCFPYSLSEIGIVVTEENLDKLCRQDDMTAEEAWEIAKKIACGEEQGGLSSVEFVDIFGKCCFEDVLSNYTPRHAKAKIEAWEAEKEIKVGDVVHVIPEHCKKKDVYYFVIRDPARTNNGYAEGIDKDGDWHCWRTEEIEKTGRHIDIQGFLEQIGGAE